MKTIAHEISASLFCWNSEHSVFVIEASELPRDFNPLGRIYPDSYDIGFVMRGKKKS